LAGDSCPGVVRRRGVVDVLHLVVSGQIKLRKIDGHAMMAAVISKRLRAAA